MEDHSSQGILIAGKPNRKNPSIGVSAQSSRTLSRRPSARSLATYGSGTWKIAARRYYLNFEAPYQGGWAALKPVAGDWQSAVAREFPPDAPAPERYAPFPAVFVPPYHYANGGLRAIQSRPPVVVQARPADELGRLETLADQKELQLARTESVRASEPAE